MSDIISENNSGKSYAFPSAFQSNQAAYIVHKGEQEEYRLPENYTPNTSLTDFEFTGSLFHQDISTICRTCNTFISLSDFNDHLDYHHALMEFGIKELPFHLSDLLRRRNALVKSMTIKILQSPEDAQTAKLCDWDAKINSINNSYELLKSYMDNTFDTNRHIKKQCQLDSKAESVIPVNSSIVSIGCCSNQNALHRKINEDAYILIEAFGDNEKKTYFGMFDGYEGHNASNMCAMYLHFALLKNISKFDPSVAYVVREDNEAYDEINNLEKFAKDDRIENAGIDKILDADKENNEETGNGETDSFKQYLNNMKEAFYESYKQMDKLLARGRNETHRARWSGSTAATCIIESLENNKTMLHVANCGDVEVLLIVDDKHNKKKYKVLSKLHTLSSNKKEKERLEQSGCSLIEFPKGKFKIEGQFDITRAFGFHGEVPIKKHISYTPSVRSYKIDSNAICLIIATKGLWKTLGYDRVADIILQMVPSRCVLSSISPSPSVRDLLDQSKSLKRLKSLSDDTKSDRSVYNKAYKNEDEEIEEDMDNEKSHSSSRTESSYISYNVRNNHNNGSDRERPKTVPYEYLHKDTNIQYTESYGKFVSEKANSDIYPVCKPKTTQNTTSDARRYEEESLTIQDYNTIIKNEGRDSAQSSETEKMKEKIMKLTFDKIVQVNKYDLNKELRNLMDPDVRYKLEFTELMTETLVNSAIVAGSCDNITVNCVLLPGWKS